MSKAVQIPKFKLTCYAFPDKERAKNGPPRPIDHSIFFQSEQDGEYQERREHDELGHVEILEERAKIDVRPPALAAPWHLELCF